MYSSKLAKNKAVTLEYILSKVTEYDIYERYLGKFKVGFIYNSPFRKDKNPSFGIFKSRKGNLLFKDHGTGECGGIIKFVSLYTGLTDYNEILQQIVKDLNITNKTVLSSTKKIEITETVIGVVRQPFTDIDKQYWAQFHISIPTLKKFKVDSIKYYLCNGIVKARYKDDNPMYCYKVNDRFKIYRPYGDKFTKWRNNLTEYDIQGYNQLPKKNKGNILFITKSLKDVMCLYEMGYDAISPSSESTFIPKDILENSILSSYKTIIVLYDRDICGMQNSRKIVKKTGLEFMFMPKKFNGKDISDCIKNNNFETVKNWINNKVKKYERKDYISA